MSEIKVRQLPHARTYTFERSGSGTWDQIALLTAAATKLKKDGGTLLSLHYANGPDSEELIVVVEDETS